MNKVMLEFFKCVIVSFELYILIQSCNAYFKKKQMSLKVVVLTEVIFFIILCFVNIYANSMAELFVLSFTLYVVLACVIYHCRVWKVLILSLGIWCLGIGMEILTFVIVALISKKNFLDIGISQGSSLWVIATIISKLFMLITIKSIIKFYSIKINNNNIPLRHWLNIMCIPIASTLLLIFSLNFFSETDRVSVKVIGAFSILIVFINIIVFNITEEIYRQADIKVENLMLKQQLIAQLEHYNQLKMNDEKIIGIIHDTKNTLFCLEKMLEQKQYEAALIHIKNTLGVLLQHSHAASYTANPVVDAFLNDKFIAAKNSGITVNTSIDKIPELKLNIIDLCLVFGNALDNAIEACNKRKSYDSAYINIKIALTHTNLKIEISNSVFEEIDVNSKKADTNRKDADLHGYGLKNIQKIIEKYNGNMGIKINENNFMFGAILPNTKLF